MLRTSVAIQQFLYRLQSRERGAGLAEYGLLLFLIAVACVGALTLLGTRISILFDEVRADLGG